MCMLSYRTTLHILYMLYYFLLEGIYESLVVIMDYLGYNPQDTLFRDEIENGQH